MLVPTHRVSESYSLRRSFWCRVTLQQDRRRPTLNIDAKRIGLDNGQTQEQELASLTNNLSHPPIISFGFSFSGSELSSAKFATRGESGRPTLDSPGIRKPNAYKALTLTDPASCYLPPYNCCG